MLNIKLRRLRPWCKYLESHWGTEEQRSEQTKRKPRKEALQAGVLALHAAPSSTHSGEGVSFWEAPELLGREATRHSRAGHITGAAKGIQVWCGLWLS